MKETLGRRSSVAIYASVLNLFFALGAAAIAIDGVAIVARQDKQSAIATNLLAALSSKIELVPLGAFAASIY